MIIPLLFDINSNSVIGQGGYILDNNKVLENILDYIVNQNNNETVRIVAPIIAVGDSTHTLRFVASYPFLSKNNEYDIVITSVNITNIGSIAPEECTIYSKFNAGVIVDIDTQKGITSGVTYTGNVVFNVTF